MYRLAVVAVLAGCRFSSGQAPSDAPDIIIDAPRPIDAIDAATDTIPGNWWDASWTHRRLVTIDGTKLAGDLTSFPILVKLDPTTIDYTAVATGGADIRFIAADNTTALDYELDTFQSGGTTFAWVRIPTLSHTAATTIWLYHGNPAATAAQNSAAVFNGFVSVHHFAGDAFPDATANHHDGATSTAGTTPAAVAGMVGSARDFDGVDDAITLAGENGFDFTTALTVSAWIHVDAFTIQYQAIVTKGDSAWRLHRGGNGGAGTGNVIDFGSTNGGNNANLDGTTNVNDNQWHYVAITYDGAAKRTFVDGAQDGMIALNVDIDKNNFPVAFGVNQESVNPALRYFNGAIDEVRITGAARDATWLAAEHTAVTDATFVTVGADQAIP